MQTEILVEPKMLKVASVVTLIISIRLLFASKKGVKNGEVCNLRDSGFPSGVLPSVSG